jgi:hypothetical protein
MSESKNWALESATAGEIVWPTPPTEVWKGE